MSTKIYKVFCLSEAVSPITHMSGSSGNESIVMREPVIANAGVVWIPKLTGNAIRHRCVREPGWRWLIDRYGLAGKLTLPQLNYCFHGGNLTEGGGREDTKRITAMQRIFPLSRLVGGCLPDQILSGSLHVWAGRLVCEENRGGVQSDMPDGWELPKEPLRSAEHFVSGYQYTRGDATKTMVGLLAEPEDDLLRGENRDGKSNLMIFAGQSVMVGACFTHGFLLNHVSQLEFGALLWSLKLWQDAGGTIGGQAARGHGRLSTSIYAGDDDGEAAIEAYKVHAESVKDDAIAWLNDAFAARVPRPKKTKEAVA